VVGPQVDYTLNVRPFANQVAIADNLYFASRQRSDQRLTLGFWCITTDFGIIAAGYQHNPDAPVQVAMAQTLINRLDRLDNTNFLIADECHHIVSATWLAILGAAQGSRVGLQRDGRTIGWPRPGRVV
jgi:superfamily II DNA or RNA helicase